MHRIVSAFHGATALLTLSVVGPDADGKKVDGLGRCGWKQKDTMSIRIDADEAVPLNREQPVLLKPGPSSLLGEIGADLINDGTIFDDCSTATETLSGIGDFKLTSEI